MRQGEKRCIQKADGVPMGITITHKGNFEKTDRFFKKLLRFEINKILSKYGEKGVAALSAATPIDTGTTSQSWSYEIEKTGSGYSITWSNSNVNKGVNIALILQTGHGTGTGGYVRGIDYINPALAPIFDEMADEAWSEVTKV